MKHLQEEELGVQGSLIMCNISSYFFTIDSKRLFIWLGFFKPSFIAWLDNPSGPNKVYLLYKLKWGDNQAIRRLDKVDEEKRVLDYNYSDIIVCG